MNLANKSVAIYHQHHHHFISSSTHFLSLFYPLKPTSPRKPSISTMSESGEAPATEDLTVNTESESITTVDPIVVEVESTPVVDGVVAAREEEEDEDLKFGFNRPEMYKEKFPKLDVDPYDRHVFLSFKSALAWPSRVEDAAYDPLPAQFALSLKNRKDQIQRKTRFTVIEGDAEAGITDGDVLIFPEMIKYKNLTHEAVDDFVEDVLVKENTSQTLGNPEKLTGFHVFVCAHANRDKRCGVCGPVLIDKLKEEIAVRGLKEKVFVSPCSHVGGHKYAGNVIVFGPLARGQIVGLWYGYVTPDDIPLLLDEHIEKGEVISHLWRGEFCKPYGEKKHDSKPQESNGIDNGEPYLNGTSLEKTIEEFQESFTKASPTQNGGSCCQGANPNGFTCCQEEKPSVVEKEEPKKGNSNICARGKEKITAWIGNLERSDVLLGVGVIGSAASAAVAYSIYRKSKSG